MCSFSLFLGRFFNHLHVHISPQRKDGSRHQEESKGIFYFFFGHLVVFSFMLLERGLAISYCRTLCFQIRKVRFDN